MTAIKIHKPQLGWLPGVGEGGSPFGLLLLGSDMGRMCAFSYSMPSWAAGKRHFKTYPAKRLSLCLEFAVYFVGCIG